MVLGPRFHNSGICLTRLLGGDRCGVAGQSLPFVVHGANGDHILGGRNCKQNTGIHQEGTAYPQNKQQTAKILSIIP